MDWTVANILFADVKGYSSLSDEQMKSFAEKIITQVAKNVNELDIIYINTWGDGIVLVAVKISDICEAALKLRDLFRGMNWSRYNLPRLDIRISVHHGEYLSGFDALTQRVGFCGSTVVTAARIEPVTPPGRIWMTEQAAIALKAHITREQAQKRPEFFAMDPIGTVELPKKYGAIDITCLRRHDEPKITNDEILAIREQEKLRINGSDYLKNSANFSERFYIVVGVVIHKGSVLLVRREDKSEGLDWMFPSGKKWPTNDDFYVIEKEVIEETGIHCDAKSIISKINSHPITKFKCVYVLLEPRDDIDIVNGDPIENETVEWVEIPEAILRIGPNLNSDVRELLQDNVSASVGA